MKLIHRGCYYVFFLLLSASLSFGQLGQGHQTVSNDPNDWPMFNHDALGTRFNSSETVISPSSAKDLDYKWMYHTAGDVYATPVVMDNTIYAGDSTGAFYALTSEGHLIWQFKAKAAITSSALVSNRMVFFGDQGGTIYGLQRATGTLVWSSHYSANWRSGRSFT